MQKFKSFASAFSGYMRSKSTVRAAKAVLIFMVICTLLSSFVVVADSSSSTFDLNNMFYLDDESITVTTNTGALYWLYQYEITTAYPSSVFSFDTEMFQFRFLSDDYSIYDNYPTVNSFYPSASFNLPIPAGYYDDTHLVFTLVTGLYSNNAPEYLLTSIIDDVVIYIDGTRYLPSQSVNGELGIYYTFTIDIEDINDDSVLTVSPFFQEFPNIDYGNFPSDVLWRLQFSPVYFTGDRDAAAAYAASIDTLLRNDIQPSLDNIETVQNSILLEFQRLDQTVAGSVEVAFDSLLDDIEAEGETFITELLEDIQREVDLSIVEDLLAAATIFTEAFTGEHVEFSLTFPSITIPVIPGLIPGATLNDPFTFDFQTVIDMMPGLLVLLVRYFCTFMLIIFVVKDFVYTINSLLTGDSYGLQSTVAVASRLKNHS